MNEAALQVEIDRIWRGIYPTFHTARKEHRCQYGRRVDGGEVCRAIIKRGERYVAGPCNFEAGPWSRDYWCMACVRACVGDNTPSKDTLTKEK